MTFREMRKRSLLASGGVLAFAAMASTTVPALAQSAPGQATTTPSRDELRGITGQAPQSAPRLSVRNEIERSPCPLEDPQYADIRVTLSEVTFNNLKEIAPDELSETWKPLAGTPQPISVLCQIRDAAGTMLRNRGYLAAVQVPTQKIENGQVRMEVIYARITTVRARGETQGAEKKLQQYLGALTGQIEGVTAAQPPARAGHDGDPILQLHEHLR